jgi:hypothetical protein
MTVTRNAFSVLAAALMSAVGLLPVGAQVAFAPQVTYTPGNQPETTALGDFNADGDLDAAVTSDAPDKVTIHANDGTGTLSLAQTVVLPNGSSPHFVVRADLDGDFDLDLAVRLKNASAVTVLFNNGGTFAASGVLMAVGAQPRSLVAVNIDGDLDFDLVASNRDSNSVSVLRNNGNGTFLSAVTIPVGLDPRHLAAGDLNGDGDWDLAIANNDSNDISLLSNDGFGNFTAGTPLGTGIFDAEGVTAIDLDGDKDLDLAAAGHDNTTAQNVVLIYLNAGGGVFTGPVTYPVLGQRPGYVVGTDVDLDGDLDLAVANQNSNDVSVLANNGAGAFGAGPAILFGVGPGPEHVTAGDLNGDQAPDLVATNDGGTTISVLRDLAPNGTLTMLNPPVIGMPVALQVASPADAGDFFLCGFSFGTAPGITFPDGRHLRANADLLLVLSLTPNNGFILNNTGFLGLDGTANVMLFIPPAPALIGLSIYANAVILNPVSNDNIEQSFGPLPVTFQ